MNPSATRFEGRPADWLDADTALARVLAASRPLPGRRVPLADAVGLALADPVVAGATLPPWDNSAMDGYAVRSVDVEGASGERPVVLPVEGVVRAGGEPPRELSPGSAIRIMTGAPVPLGADTVIRVEDTDREREPGRVRILDDRDLGRHVRAAGQDMARDDVLFHEGHTITPGAIGVLAASGHAEVAVHGSPKVGILSTGDELRPLHRYSEVAAGRGVPESNGPMLAAMVEAVRGQPIRLGIATDDVEDLRRKIEGAAEADVLLTIGGASMGEADLVKRVLDELGYDQEFWRVRMRPGSPLSFGWIPRGDRRQPIFGLPGNPSSAFVTFEVFVRPFLLRQAGHRAVLRRTITCTAAETIDTPAPLTYFQRVVVGDGDAGTPVARLTGPQLSGLVRGLATADGLAVIPPDRDSVGAGEPVRVMLLDPAPAVAVFPSLAEDRPD